MDSMGPRPGDPIRLPHMPALSRALAFFGTLAAELQGSVLVRVPKSASSPKQPHKMCHGPTCENYLEVREREKNKKRTRKVKKRKRKEEKDRRPKGKKKVYYF